MSLYFVDAKSFKLFKIAMDMKAKDYIDDESKDAYTMIAKRINEASAKITKGRYESISELLAVTNDLLALIIDNKSKLINEDFHEHLFYLQAKKDVIMIRNEFQLLASNMTNEKILKLKTINLFMGLISRKRSIAPIVPKRSVDQKALDAFKYRCITKDIDIDEIKKYYEDTKKLYRPIDSALLSLIDESVKDLEVELMVNN